MRRRLAPLLALVLALQGCPGAGTPTGTSPSAAARKSPRPVAPTGSATPAPQATGAGGSAAPLLMATGAPRPIAQTGDLAQLTGKVKLISDHGASIITNNGGTLISDSGGGLVSNNSAGLVSNNSAGLVANNSAGLRVLAQTAEGQAESPLADAAITVFDGAGQQLVDDAGKPIAAVTDRTGAYKLAATLPAENLVLKVKLWNGGELMAIVPKADQAGQAAREVAVDTSATLGATYVLTQFVKGDAATFAKLPASEADRLRRELDAARGLLGGKPAYTADALVALTDALRAKAPGVDQSLADIKALLLGQANLGAGRLATDVPLGDPRALLRLADGSLLVSECMMGRIRRLAPDGTITTWLDSIHGEKVKANWFRLSDLAQRPDGTIYAADGGAHFVHAIAPDGTTAKVFGDGREDVDALGATALTCGVAPWGVALAKAGGFYVGESYRGSGKPPRASAGGADGSARLLAPSPEAWKWHGIVRVIETPDGGHLALLRRKTEPDGLWKLAPGASDWTLVTRDLALDKEGYLMLDPEGRVVISENEAGRVVRLAADGTKTVLAGAGGPPGTAALVAPAGLLYEPGGTLLIADGGANAVWRLETAGTLTRLAGAAKATQAGDALAINAPGGVGFDSRGRMLVAEGGSHTVKRLDGTTLETFAGDALGYAGDGGPASAARFHTPTGIAVKDDAVWVMDSGNRRLRQIDAAGVIRTVVGSYIDFDVIAPDVPVAPEAYAPVRSLDLELGPDGRPIWSTIARHQVHRLRADGKVELLAGKGGGKGAFGGDGGHPTLAKLDTPLGVTYGPDGALYIADAGNMRIRRVSPDGQRIETYAGKDRFATMVALPADTGAPTTRQDALIVLPSAVCMDAQGNLYVGELGTVAIPLLASVTGGLAGLDPALLPKATSRIRKIAADGTVTTLAGPGGKFFADPLAGDALILPTGLAIDPKGRLAGGGGGAPRAAGPRPRPEGPPGHRGRRREPDPLPAGRLLLRACGRPDAGRSFV